jgi:hypothetical protein
MPIKTNRHKKPVNDIGRLTKKKRKKLKDLEAYLRPQGTSGTDGVEPLPLFNRSNREKVFRHKNSYIVLGKDRHASIQSTQYGTGGSMIDLVVGRGSSFKPVGSGQPYAQMPDANISLNTNFYTDAARVYISQKADIDYYFGLADVALTDKEQRSAVGLKADQVRIIGRRSIKIVTGKGSGKGGPNGEFNADGGKIDGPGTISLIAGNYTGQSTVPILPFMAKIRGVLQDREEEELNVLQPIPKGDNLIACIRHIAAILSDLSSMVMANSQGIKEIAGATALHFHDYGGGFGPTTPPSLLAAEMVPTYIQAWIDLMQNYSSTWNQIVLENDFLNETSPLYINSRHVSTT